MSMVTIGKNGRIYKRKFDHEEAIRRHREGESVAALAKDYGVNWAAVARVVDPVIRSKMALQSAAQQMSGVCERCGKIGAATTARWCRDCWALETRTTIRPTELHCSRCLQWKPDDAFPRNRSEKSRRGRHGLCRSCNSQVRRDYRNRNKVPCPKCGAPTSQAETEGRRTAFGYCHACSHNKENTMPVEPTFIVLVQESEGLWREHGRVAAKDKRDALTMSFNGEPPKELIAVVSLQAFRPGRLVPVQVYDLEIE